MRENIVTIVNIVSALCLIYMVGVVVYAAVPIVNAKNRGERLKLLSGFKKGKFVLIYFAAIPLYLVAHVFNGEAAAGALWMSIKSCVDTVILKFDYSSAAALMAENVFYTVVIEICFVLVVVNAALFAAALFGQRVYNFVRARCAWRAKKLYVIVGLNKHNIELLASVGHDAGAVLVADGSKEARDALNHPCPNLLAGAWVFAKAGRNARDPVSRMMADMTAMMLRMLIQQAMEEQRRREREAAERRLYESRRNMWDAEKRLKSAEKALAHEDEREEQAKRVRLQEREDKAARRAGGRVKYGADADKQYE